MADDTTKALVEALRKAVPILRHLGSGVFNDNGDLSTSPPPRLLGFADYEAAYWAARAGDRALAAHDASAGAMGADRTYAEIRKDTKEKFSETFAYLQRGEAHPAPAPPAAIRSTP